MKAIPTVYSGIRFRSRLEARWAVFFDALNITWRYEYEGYQLPSGWYLPDFWLPEILTHIEIKPKEPTEEEGSKCGELAAATSQRVVLFYGDIGWWLKDLYPSDMKSGGEAFFPPVPGIDETWGWDEPYIPCVCVTCGRCGIEFDGRSARICRHDSDDKSYNSDDERIILATRKANAYRFAYGDQ